MSTEPQIELNITALAFGGDGLGREESGPAQGRVVFVSGVLPGEKVRVALTKQKKDFARGRLVEIIRTSDKRIEPPCTIIDKCGGCPWQHGEISVQRSSKSDIVRTAVERLCHRQEVEPPEAEPIVVGEPFGYRSRIRTQLRKKPTSMTMGFRGKGSKDLVDVPQCIVANAEVNRGLDIVRKTLASHLTEGEGSVVISGVAEGSAVISIRLRRGTAEGLAQRLVEAGAKGATVRWAQGEENAGEPFLDWAGEASEDEVVQIRATGFAQGNPEVFQTLVKDVIGNISEMDPPPKRVVELFCGAGTLTLPISGLVSEVIAFEGNEGAIEDLESNAKRMGRENISAHEMDLQDPENLVDIVDGDAEVVVLDPPREGAKGVMDSILKIGPQRVLYVSCDPITQTRDLSVLLENGYLLTSLKTYDMFPQTPHMETLAVLHQKSPVVED